MSRDPNRRSTPAQARAAYRRRKLARRQVQETKEFDMATICKGKTAAGIPCKVKTNDASGYCPAHRSQAQAQAGGKRSARRRTSRSTVQGHSDWSILVVGLIALALVGALIWMVTRPTQIVEKPVYQTVEKEVVRTVEVEVPGPETTVIVEVPAATPTPDSEALTAPANSTLTVEEAAKMQEWTPGFVNPENNTQFRGNGPTWEELSGRWLMPDGSTYEGTRQVVDGQPVGIWLEVGPFGYTCEDLLKVLVSDPIEREKIYSCRPQGQNNNNGDSGWWTIETDKTKACDSGLGDGSKVPCDGPVITWTLAMPGRFDWWGGFNPPTPSTGCTVYKGFDGDSLLKNWQVDCQGGSDGQATQSDGMTWYPAYSGFYPDVAK